MLHNGSLASPMSYMFSVDRRSALQRSKAFLEANYRMCKVGVYDQHSCDQLAKGVRLAKGATLAP